MRIARYLTVPALAATMAFMGPPWISIETPPNPFDSGSRGSYLLVHAFHHGTPVNFPVAGTAEGIVDGTRRTIDHCADAHLFGTNVRGLGASMSDFATLRARMVEALVTLRVLTRRGAPRRSAGARRARRAAAPPVRSDYSSSCRSPPAAWVCRCRHAMNG